jgi:hypothetical protein
MNYSGYFVGILALESYCQSPVLILKKDFNFYLKGGRNAFLDTVCNTIANAPLRTTLKSNNNQEDIYQMIVLLYLLFVCS